MTGETAEAVLLTVIGLAMGSFLGLASLRMPAGRGVVSGRSACASCGRQLGALDLVPVVSWLALRGRCRSCGAAIPARYPAMESTAALIGFWAALAFSGPPAWISAAFGWWLLLIAVIDFEHFWLPRVLTGPLVLAGLAEAAGLAPQDLPARLIGAAIGWSLLILVAALYRRLRGREGLGGGDPLMLAAVGAWVGWRGLPSVLLVAAALGLAAALATRRLKPDARLPFGSLMAVGAWLVWIFGPIGPGF